MAKTVKKPAATPAKQTIAKKKTARPYSTRYTAAGTPRRYLLSGIPAGLWIKVRAQAKREEISVRTLILSLLEGWLFSRDPKTQVANVLASARRAITPEMRRQLAEREAKRRTARDN